MFVPAIILMKKINFLRAALFWSLNSVESCAVTELTAQFEGKKKSFWEKNAENMSDTLSWLEFLETAKNIQSIYFKDKEAPFIEYSFDKRRFTKIPGFDDGSCLWSHLGITPKNMYDQVVVPYIKKVIIPYVNNIKKCNSKSSNDDLASKKLMPELFELLDFLDPLEKISKDTGDAIKRFIILTKQTETVRTNWLNSVETNGGKEIIHNNNRVAFRPANGTQFFQEVAGYLKTNIVIFSGDSESLSLKLSREFIVDHDVNTLYLLQDDGSFGLHYDVLVEQNSPVSKAIVEEMKSYMGSKKRFSQK